MYILHCSRFPGSLEMDSCIIIIIKISLAEHSLLGATSHRTLKSARMQRLPKDLSGLNQAGFKNLKEKSAIRLAAAPLDFQLPQGSKQDGFSAGLDVPLGYATKAVRKGLFQGP